MVKACRCSSQSWIWRNSIVFNNTYPFSCEGANNIIARLGPGQQGRSKARNKQAQELLQPRANALTRLFPLMRQCSQSGSLRQAVIIRLSRDWLCSRPWFLTGEHWKISLKLSDFPQLTSWGEHVCRITLRYYQWSWDSNELHENIVSNGIFYSYWQYPPAHTILGGGGAEGRGKKSTQKPQPPNTVNNSDNTHCAGMRSSYTLIQFEVSALFDFEELICSYVADSHRKDKSYIKGVHLL